MWVRSLWTRKGLVRGNMIQLPMLVLLLIGGEEQQFVTGFRAFDWRFAYIENLTTRAS